MNITRSVCNCIDQGYAFRNRMNESGCTALDMGECGSLGCPSRVHDEGIPRHLFPAELCVLPKSRPISLVKCEKLCGFPCE